MLPNDKKLKQSMPSIKVDGSLKTDKNAIADGFNHFFISIVKTISDKLSQRSPKISCQRQQSPLQNTEATFTNEKFRAKFSKTKCCLQFVAKAKSEQSNWIR